MSINIKDDDLPQKIMFGEYSITIDTMPGSKKKTLDLRNDMKNWNASNNSRVDASEDRIQINIPQGGYGSSGGVNLKFKPDGIKPTPSFELEFQVRFPDNFDWVKGGKFGLGANINEGAGGSSWKKNDGSARLMWRAGGQLVSYLYLCTDQGSYRPGDENCPLVKNQRTEFKDACGNKWNKSGLDVFRYTKEKLYLKKGYWNTIKYGATLNSGPDTSDGKVWLELNGERVETGGIRFTENVRDNVFSQIQLPTWFGGSDKSWAPPKNTWVKIRNATYKMTQ